MPTISKLARVIILGGSTITSLAPNVRAAFIPTTRQAANISWFVCPDSATTQCAFFDVPMDYSNPSNNATVSIFMRKFPATVPADQRLGTILVNPGGPGASGGAWAASSGEAISTRMEGRYDILGFDPRGVNLTGPSTACFDAEAKFLHQIYQVQMAGAPFPDVGGSAGEANVKKIAAIQEGHPAACMQNGNKQILQSVGTVAVAQDIVRIVEALGEDGLNYLGYSYGTILGATFAALYPDMVKRMVLDGVSDAESYFDDTLQWGRGGLANAHKAFDGFFSTCIEAGPELCALAQPKNGSQQVQTVESLHERLDAIYSKLSSDPLTVGDSSAGPGILRATDVQLGIFNALYTPKLWPDMAMFLAKLEAGDGSGVYSAVNLPAYEIQPKPYNENIYNRSMQIYDTRESLVPILCGDSPPLNISVGEYREYFRDLGKFSPVGEQWAITMGTCRGWPFRANQRYTGPWTTAKGLKKTRFPILFVSLDGDPVTPLPSAVKMSRGFGNDSATLLVQHGYGHCSIAHPSLCTIKRVRDYFVDGTVPANGTHCDPEPGFIYPESNNTSAKRGVRQLSKRDEELLRAVETMDSTRRKLAPVL